MSRVRYRTFLAFNAAGGAVWAAETAAVGYLAGASYRAVENRLSVIGPGVLALPIAAYALHLLRRQPRVSAWLAARTDRRRWTGRPLTLTVAAAGATTWLSNPLLLTAAALGVGQLILVGICGLVRRARPPHVDWFMSAYGYSYPSGTRRQRCSPGGRSSP